MAFTTTVHDRHLDEMRFDGQQFPTTYAPLRSSTELNTHPATADIRAGLTRRFTTDAMIPSAMTSSVWDPSRLPRIPVAETLDLAPMDADERQRVHMLIQQKQLAYESRRQEQKKYETQMKLMELQNRKDEEEILLMAQNLDRMALMNNSHDRISLSAGPNEPTTPPELRDTPYNRSKAMSGASALATPPTVSGRSEQQQLITPPAEDVLSLLSQNNSKSVPGSRRNSDENQVNMTPTQAPIGQRSSIRNAIPNNAIDKQMKQGGSSRFGLGQINTADFLFDDEQVGKNSSSKKTQTTSPDVKSYLQMMDTNDKFPVLTQSHHGRLSASSAALDLAYSENAAGPTEANMWGNPSFTRAHRPAQHSLPINHFPYTPTSNSSPKVVVPQTDSPATARRYERATTDFPFAAHSENLNAKHSEQESGHARQASMPKLQPSFSTSDLPTMRNPTGVQNNSFGRGPIDRQRHNREPSVTAAERSLVGGTMFGPPLSGGLSPMPMMSPSGMSPLPSPGLYGSYGHINLSNINGPMFHAAGPYGAYPLYAQAAKSNDSSHPSHQMQGRSVQKRNHDGEVNRFANVKLESLVNEIYSLCKDQHGCRYLQKKLEEGNPQYVDMIFRETHPHVVELMTDPFGNYLCQKLLEFTNHEQRTVLVNTAAPRLVDIALNQHGTRALQKMIEFLSTREQIETIVHALESKVVELIQDLNGNHVIQKCLNRLKPEDAQFIFDAVGEHCIPVGTHRHGCCVLQRCIDHASGAQKIQLIQKITAHSLELVQDAFGNYVVQYILDLAEPKLSEPVILQFRGMICDLAKQKFSSNVIEKCIRVAEPPTKKILIEEMIASGRIEDMLRDCYANYVIQTSIDYADAATRQRLAETILPLLPSIRNFPYGRRIQSKLAMADSKTNMPFQSGAVSAGHSRSNSYSQPSQARPSALHNNQGPVRPTPVQQHSYPPPFRPEMGAQFLM